MLKKIIFLSILFINLKAVKKSCVFYFSKEYITYDLKDTRREK